MNLLRTLLRRASLEQAWASTRVDAPETVPLEPGGLDELPTQPAPLAMMVDTPEPARG